MVEFIKLYQLDIMLLLCGACGILILLLLHTRFLSGERKVILILLEIFALFLLWFDRLAYIYSGDVSTKGYIMIRVSNGMVFLMTSAIVFGFNMYLSNLLKEKRGDGSFPKRLLLTGAGSAAGMVLAVIAAFTDLYYYFDEANVYHRADGFFIAYIFPVLCSIIQYTVIRQYKSSFSRLIYISLNLYIFVPLTCAILQIFLPKTSIVNLAMALASVSLYVFMYLDLNDTVEKMHETEIQDMQGEQIKMYRLFDQTATAFVSAVEKKDEFVRGNSLRIAEYAKEIARRAGKSEEDCRKAYYAAMLHDVGLIGIPDSVIKNDTDPDKRDIETMRMKPLISEEILSCITEYPYLCKTARYTHERYNGSGYPDGLKGEDIPEISRIIGTADAYVTMTTKKRYRDAIPGFMAREVFLKGAGEEFDPEFARIMVNIMDTENTESSAGNTEEQETEIVCKEYREHVSRGVPIDESTRKITFECELSKDPGVRFSAPSIILFDSYDGRIHDGQKDIERYGYLEYGEIWFDKNSVTTAARKIEEKETDDAACGQSDDGNPLYEIIAGRYEDHLKIVMKSDDYAKEVIVALPNVSKASYIGLTGENCRIKNIETSLTGESVQSEDMPRIAQPVSYIEHFESDIKNIQIDRTLSAATEGIELKNRLIVRFHTMSLPAASLVWNCPYVMIFSSDDGSIGGPNYKEYNMIKLDGEDQGDGEYAKNRFVMKKTKDFPGWDVWKETNKEGIECEIFIEKRGRQVVFKTVNVGISIENTTTIKEEGSKVYVALTGDQVALTDIRITST